MTGIDGFFARDLLFLASWCIKYLLWSIALTGSIFGLAGCAFLLKLKNWG